MKFPHLLGYAPLFLALAGCAIGGNVSENGTCSLSSVHMDTNTKKLMSDCDDRTFCFGGQPPLPGLATNGTCTKKSCRKDEFPFGFNNSETLPPFCGAGTYCTDEGDACKAVVPPGYPCDLNRDYQCLQPANSTGVTAICLGSTCMYTNITVELPCTLNRTTYYGFSVSPDGQKMNRTVLRDNCLGLYYCDGTSMTCVVKKVTNYPCEDDRECQTGYCDTSNYCSPEPVPPRLKPWHYALTTISILGATMSICTFLSLSHERRRMARYSVVQSYLDEQMSLRSSIASMHTMAANRLPLSSNSKGRSR